MQRVVDVIAQRLAEAGCQHAFGIPGGETLALLDALQQQKIQFVLTKHENSAGFMAEGVYHSNSAPAVLVATIGPGVANAVNVIANAEQDRVPLLFLTGCVDDAQALRYTHQVFDHRALLKPIVKASFTATSEAIDVLIDKALAIATDDPPGPVHIDIPVSVATAQAIPRGQRPRQRPQRSSPAPGVALDQARAWLAHARRPIAISGVDALFQHGEATVKEFVEAFNIPLITSYKGKGILPEDHPLALGGAGLSPQADRLLLPLLEQSDLILLLGYDPIEMRTGWRNPWPEAARVVEFSAQPNRHDMHHASLHFVSNIAAGIGALSAHVCPSPTWPDGQPQRAREKLHQAYRANEQWGPAAIVDSARKTLPANTVATVDSGAHRILLSQVWQCYSPRTLLQSTGLCTMGCALPLAMGAKIAEPQRPAVAFTGDAGLEMVIGELATLRDLSLGVIIIVFVDHSLALIELKQRGMQLANTGVDFGASNFAAIAQGFGGQGYTVNDRTGLEDAIRSGLSSQAPFTLIACEIDHPSYDGRI